MKPVVYNPAFLKPEERIRQFVVRHEELHTIVRALETDTSPTRQHLLLLGGRGLGKSTLVQRVVAEVERTELAERWYPLVFPEETYEAANIGEFWLEALYRLADQTRDPRWVGLHQELHRERDAQRLALAARGALEAHATEIGRSILLVVENLDMLMDQLDDQDARALREVLQTSSTFLLLATALRPFDVLTAHAGPFYEGFRRTELHPLTALEIEALWEQVTGTRPGLHRAQAVRVLTGGNPRMVVLLAQLADGHSLRGILSALPLLVDAHTDYFKGNIEALEGQNRRVFLALATLWYPSTAGQVAEEARLDGNTVSTILSRLERQGRIEVVGKKGKNRQYQVAERLYNIYYLMRRRGGTDARLEALIEFMVLFYEPDELGGLVRHLSGDARIQLRALEEQLPEEAWALAARVQGQLATGDLPAALRTSELLAATGVAPEHAAVVSALVDLAQGDLASANAHLLRSMAIHPSSNALTLRALVADRLGDDTGAISLSGELVRGEPSSEIGWSILSRRSPTDALAVWDALRNPTLAAAIAFVKGAVHAPDRRVWGAALQHAPLEDGMEPNYALSLARLEGLFGRADRALDIFSRLAQRDDAGTTGQRPMTFLATALAASGLGLPVAKALAGAPARALFRPLLLALEPTLLPEFSAEERAVADDIFQRLQTLRTRADLWQSELSLPDANALFPRLSQFEVG